MSDVLHQPIGVLATLALVAVTGYLVKSWISARSKHEFDLKLEQEKRLAKIADDRNIERFKARERRAEVLLSERLAAYKRLQPVLLALARYSSARRFGVSGSTSDFSPNEAELTEGENSSLLEHNDSLRRVYEETAYALSTDTKQELQGLFQCLGIGANLELHLAGPAPLRIFIEGAVSNYAAVETQVDKVLEAARRSLDLSANVA